MIFLVRQVITTWEAHVRSTLQRETGGMLLGHETVSDQLVITHATEPGPAARRRPFGFEPDQEWDRELVARIYRDSGRVTTYLGEWHSHPFGRMRPSRDDAQTIRSVAAHEGARVAHPLTAIVSRTLRGELRWMLYRLNGDGGLTAVRATLIELP